MRIEYDASPRWYVLDEEGDELLAEFESEKDAREYVQERTRSNLLWDHLHGELVEIAKTLLQRHGTENARLMGEIAEIAFEDAAEALTKTVQ
jgi:hypothetical protein